MGYNSVLTPEYEEGDINLSPFRIYPYKDNAALAADRRQAALDGIRIVERDCLCRSEFSRLFAAVSIKTQKRFDINCRSWRCPKHRERWGRKWGLTIGEQLKTRPVTLLVNLTTKEMIGNQEIVEAIRFFFRRFRDFYGATQYIKVVEYNKKHTQPHFHLLLSCDDLKIPPMPAKFKTKEGKKLSWPYDVFSVIKDFWTEALCYAAPGAGLTTVVWCQPPVNQAASANYALGYITGKSTKDEEPNSTWKGRKLSYSRKFFDRSTAEIWADILREMFPDRDETDVFCWELKPPGDQLPGDDPAKFASVEIMNKRWAMNHYFLTYGEMPSWDNPPIELPEFIYDIGEFGQESFIPELIE